MKTRSNKKIANIVLSIALVAVIAVGGSLAWLSYQTNSFDNKFTLANADPTNPDMMAEIIEEFDPNSAKDLRPAGVVNKKITVKNNSKAAIDEWVAVKLTFEKGDSALSGAQKVANMEDLNKVMQSQFGATFGNKYNNTDWMRKNTGDFKQEEIFYYRNKLAQGVTTPALIDKVNILTSATNAEIQTVYTWKGFNIKVTGAAVQGEMSSTLTDDVKTALDVLL